MSGAEPERGGSVEHQVTPLELFFDLVFVFAMLAATAAMLGVALAVPGGAPNALSW